MPDAAPGRLGRLLLPQALTAITPCSAAESGTLFALLAVSAAVADLLGGGFRDASVSGSQQLYK